MNPLQRPFRFAIALLVFISGLGSAMTQAATFAITQAQWSTSNGGRLIVAGSGTSNRTVTIKNAVSGTVLGTDRVDRRKMEQFDPKTFATSLQSARRTIRGRRRRT